MGRIPPLARQQVLERDFDCCRRCHVHATVRGLSVHHRQGRAGPDPHRLGNLVALCGDGVRGCHGWAHAHPAEAYKTGWMVRRLGDEDPAEIPMQPLSGGYVFITDEGGLVVFPHLEEVT